MDLDLDLDSGVRVRVRVRACVVSLRLSLRSSSVVATGRGHNAFRLLNWHAKCSSQRHANGSATSTVRYCMTTRAPVRPCVQQ